jgi:hypothetical protein
MRLDYKTNKTRKSMKAETKEKLRAAKADLKKAFQATAALASSLGDEAKEAINEFTKGLEQDIADLQAEKSEMTPEPTFGEDLVGYTFNPSGNENVQEAKRLAAALADVLHRDYEERFGKRNCNNSFIASVVYQQAIGEILNAQMNTVKLLTLHNI